MRDRSLMFWCMENPDKAAVRIAALEAAATALMAEYEQGQFPDNHPEHRTLWDALRAALVFAGKDKP